MYATAVGKSKYFAGINTTSITLTVKKKHSPFYDRPLCLPVQMMQLMPVKCLELLLPLTGNHALITQHAAFLALTGDLFLGKDRLGTMFSG